MTLHRILKISLLSRCNLTTPFPLHPFAYPYPNDQILAFGAEIGLWEYACGNKLKGGITIGTKVCMSRILEGREWDKQNLDPPVKPVFHRTARRYLTVNVIK